MEQLEGCYGCWSLARRITEADATIAALQARVQELEDGTSALLNQQSERLAAENEKLMMALSQLTQRTAELEAAEEIERFIDYSGGCVGTENDPRVVAVDRFIAINIVPLLARLASEGE